MLQVYKKFSSRISLFEIVLRFSYACIRESPATRSWRALPAGSLVGHDVHEQIGLVSKAQSARNRPTNTKLGFVAGDVGSPQAGLCPSGRGQAKRLIVCVAGREIHH